MKRIVLLTAAFLLGWSFTSHAVIVTPIYRTLTVDLHGWGTVESDPAGINCTDGAGACSAKFINGSTVVLLATPRPADENGTYYFGTWNEDPSRDFPAIAVLMDRSKTVTAQFTALGIPVALLPAPTGSDIYYYHPVAEPELSGPPSMRPIGIGANPTMLDIQVKLPGFTPNVDIYLGLGLDGFGDLILFGPGSAISTLSGGLVAWKQNVVGVTDESLFGPIPMAGLPAGTYRLFLMVTPAGDMSKYYLWETYFEYTPSPPNPFP